MRHLPLLLLALPLLADEPKTVTRPSGLKIEFLAEGKPGTAPKIGDTVRAHYTGWLADGTKFDSSKDGGQPFQFVLGLGMSIPAWEEAIPLMDIGGKCKLHVPAALGYGDAGNPQAGIPPKADLVFEIELVEVEKGREFRAADPAKQKATASGLKWEVLEEGAGDPIQPKDLVELRCTIWTTEGKLLFTTAAFGLPIAGEVSGVHLTKTIEKFLPEAVQLMKEGGQGRFEVSAELGWGKAKVHPELEPGSATVWQVDVERVVRFGPFDATKVKKTASGLEVEVVREGTGLTPGPADRVAVFYTGWLDNGTEFDSSHRRGRPEFLAMGEIIAGWKEGLQLMKTGGICRFRIPAALGYGAMPRTNIPPNSTLVFEVELLRVLR